MVKPQRCFEASNENFVMESLDESDSGHSLKDFL